MRRATTIRLLTAAALTATLAACASGPKGGGGGNAPRPATVQSIGNAQELGDVESLLDRGQVEDARRKLAAMVKRDPADVRSRALLDSLTADPQAILGAKAFDYRVQPGDTLQALSQRFLGDRMRFWLLARYNNVAVPAALRPGQTLRIPGEAPKAAPPPPRREPPAVQKAPPAAKPERPAPPPVSAANPRRAAQRRAAGLAALNRGQVAQAVGLLQQAGSDDPANPQNQRDLARARRLQQTVRARR